MTVCIQGWCGHAEFQAFFKSWEAVQGRSYAVVLLQINCSLFNIYQFSAVLPPLFLFHFLNSTHTNWISFCLPIFFPGSLQIQSLVSPEMLPDMQWSADITLTLSRMNVWTQLYVRIHSNRRVIGWGGGKRVWCMYDVCLHSVCERVFF